MSFVIVGSVIAASTVVTAYGQYQAGKAEEIALKQRAKDEEFRAETEELQRRQQLNKTLAANQVAMAMSGVKAEGSPASISLRSAQQASLSEGVIGLSEKLKQAQLVRQGSEAARAGRMRAGATLLSGAADIAQL